MKNIVDAIKDAFMPPEPSQTDAIKLLKADHRMVDTLFKEYFDASDREKVLKSLLNELTVHATIEEELVYPLLAEVEAAKTAEGREEHQLMKLLMAELEVSQFNGTEELTAAKVTVLKEIVTNHVKEEERELLPRLKFLTDVDELGQQILKAKKKAAAAAKRSERLLQRATSSTVTGSKTKTSAKKAPSSVKTNRTRQRKAS